MTTLREENANAQKRLRASLVDYALHRSKIGVGQFLDKDGRESDQSGLFGMSTWLCMAGKTQDDNVARVTHQCLQELKSTVDRARAADAAFFAAVSEEHAFEIWQLVPKTAAALEALTLFPDAHDQAGVLQKRLTDLQKTDGSWPFQAGAPAGYPFATALAVRSLMEIKSAHKQVELALGYLDKNFDKTGSLSERLFVLNALEQARLAGFRPQDARFDPRAKMKEAFRAVFKEVRSNPIGMANPLNVDYHAFSRTRYYRVATDLLLLESLLLLSGPGLCYLRAHVGRRLLERVQRNVTGQTFEKDGSGHRLSSGNCFYLAQLLSQIERKGNSKWPEFLLKVGAILASATSFSVNFAFNVVIRILVLLVGVVALLFSYEKPGWACLGVALKIAIDGLRSMYETYRGKEMA